ncbi:MAG: crossover junction endodeoxyribonuclease RuvC [Leptolyngbya sp. SIO3F4]|nr:crossover junction endodeoxyribonuclease RuvC [Leptolyngbya sp. SIO3F4]
MNEDRVILGIDPGTNLMGYGIIQVKRKQLSLLDMGVFEMRKLPSHAAKLRKIFEGTLALVEQHHPDEMAIEAPFYGKNVQSMLSLGRAQGVAMAAAVYRDVPIVEYSPRKIKQSITGKGSASKEQVASMLVQLLNLGEAPKHLDATDGLAAAVCHYFQGGAPASGSNYSGWSSFVKKNPDRLT